MPECVSVTHIGKKRKQNQDRTLISDLEDGALLVAVADGVGGHAGGEVAAQIAVDSLANSVQDSRLSLEPAFLDVCKAIERAAAQNPELAHMGTTLTAAIIDKHLLRWSHLGDTRLYLFRDGVLSQLTRDDTAAEELIEAGRLSKEEAQDHPARHLLFECLGCGDCEPASGELQLFAGDLIMICSDGLYGEIAEKQIRATISDADSLQTAADNLIDGALKAGGRDNISVVLVQV